jgi:predicted porin
MKRTILSIGLLAMAATAAAQSSVNISGVLKVATARANGGTTFIGDDIEKGWSMIDLSSALIFSGKEDLGGGMYAGFELASFLAVDAGTARNPYWSRRSVVKLGGSFGEIYAGRSLTPQELMTLLIDPWYWDGSAANMGWHVQQAHYRSSAFIRTNNTLGYVSPAMSGFKLSLAASAGEGGGKRDVGGSLTYDNGPLSLGVAHDRGHGLDNTAPTDHVTTVVGSYDFGVAKPRASFTKSQVNGEGYSSFALAVTVPVGPAGTVMAQYGHLDDADTAVAGKQKLNRFGLGYQHALSKRTNVFAQVSQAKAESFSAKNVAEFGIEHSF